MTSFVLERTGLLDFLSIEVVTRQSSNMPARSVLQLLISDKIRSSLLSLYRPMSYTNYPRSLVVVAPGTGNTDSRNISPQVGLRKTWNVFFSSDQSKQISTVTEEQTFAFWTLVWLGESLKPFTCYTVGY